MKNFFFDGWYIAVDQFAVSVDERYNQGVEIEPDKDMNFKVNSANKKNDPGAGGHFLKVGVYWVKGL